MAEPTSVYTDGACSGNPGPGGWAWVVPDGPFGAGPAADTTNQRMELTAVLEAVTTLPGELLVVSDSTYVVNCFRDGWWEGWLARGWTNSQKKPVANRDLWEPLIERYRAGPAIEFRWVKGHAGDRWNDLADQLAVEAARRQEPRSGDRSPESVDVPRAPSRSDRPDGHLLVVFGHQPPELGGYEDNPVARDVQRRLVELLAAKKELHPSLVVVTGLRQGAETLAAEAAISAKVPFDVVLPFPDPDDRWPAPARRRFAELRGLARDERVLQSTQPESTKSASDALTRRDAWLARNVDEAVAVWDREDPRVGRTAARYEAELGEDVWYLEPRPGRS